VSKKLVKLMVVTLLLILAVNPVSAKVVVGINAEYTIISHNTIRDIFTLTFKNTNKNTTPLNIAIPISLSLQNITVKDVPRGYVSYTIKNSNNGKVLLLRISKTLSPFESYKVIIDGYARGTLDSLGNGIYRFTAVVYPDYFNNVGIPVDSIKLAVSFPQQFLFAYRVTSVSSNSKVYYNYLNSVERVEWDFINPTTQVVASIQFQKIPNLMAVDILAALIIFSAFLALFYINYRSEKKYRKMKILFSTPWGGNIVSTIREMFGKAEREILITSPHIYYTDWLTAELKPALDRGVNVRIITWPSYERRLFKNVHDVRDDKKQYFTLKRFLEMFPPGTVRLNDNIHAKMVIVDESKVLITTANLTQTGLWENYEVGFKAENEELSEQAKNFFEMVWNSEDTIELNEETIHPDVAWKIIMEKKKQRE